MKTDLKYFEFRGRVYLAVSSVNHWLEPAPGTITAVLTAYEKLDDADRKLARGWLALEMQYAFDGGNADLFQALTEIQNAVLGRKRKGWSD